MTNSMTSSAARHDELSPPDIEKAVAEILSMEDKEPIIRKLVKVIAELRRDRDGFATAIEEIIRFCYAELFFVDSDPAWDLYKGIQRVVAEELNKPQHQLVDDIWKETIEDNKRKIDLEEQRTKLLNRVASLEGKLRESGIEVPEEE